MVLYDTLLETFSHEEARSVVAHELAHVRYRDVPRQLVFVAARRRPRRRARSRRSPRGVAASRRPGLPALALAGAVVSTPVGIVARQLSRAIERRADAFSLELTDEPEAFISFERRLTGQNLADPDPPRWLSRLLGTHPPIVERIGIAEAYRAGERPTLRRVARSGALELRQALDALARLPARVVVFERGHQLAHEARREADAGDDDAGISLSRPLVDARERDRELVVGVADVREVRVDARHHLRRDLDVDVAVAAGRLLVMAL